MIWVSWSPGHSLHHPGCNDAARVTQCDVWRVTAWHGNDGPHQSHPSQPRASHSVHHIGRAGWGDASGEVTSPYCTPPGTQSFVSRYHLHTLELSHGAFYTDTHLFHCGCGEQDSGGISNLSPSPGWWSDSTGGHWPVVTPWSQSGAGARQLESQFLLLAYFNQCSQGGQYPVLVTPTLVTTRGRQQLLVEVIKFECLVVNHYPEHRVREPSGEKLNGMRWSPISYI